MYRSIVHSVSQLFFLSWQLPGRLLTVVSNSVHKRIRQAMLVECSLELHISFGGRVSVDETLGYLLSIETLDCVCLIVYLVNQYDWGMLLKMYKKC
jgi:hypothetical protein